VAELKAIMTLMMITITAVMTVIMVTITAIMTVIMITIAMSTIKTPMVSSPKFLQPLAS